MMETEKSNRWERIRREQCYENTGRRETLGEGGQTCQRKIEKRPSKLSVKQSLLTLERIVSGE